MSHAIIATVNVLMIFLLIRLFISYKWFMRAMSIIDSKFAKAKTLEELHLVRDDLDSIDASPLPTMFNLMVWTFDKAYPRFAKMQETA